MALIRAGGMGQVHASMVANDVIRDLFPQIILLVGIAAGLGGEVDLGDIVIADQIVDYEMGKIRNGQMKYQFPKYATNPELAEALSQYRDINWHQNIGVRRPDGKSNILPNVHRGDVFCGNKVIDDIETVTNLLEHFRKVVALEMESYGVACTLHFMNEAPKFGMVKAICDKATEKSDDWQDYAASAAAAYVLDFLKDTKMLLPRKGFKIRTEQEIEEETDQIIDGLDIDPRRISEFQLELIRNIVLATLKETNDILRDKYESHINHGQHFLLRAAPLFKNASEICAVSLDTISTFWISKENQATVKTYIDKQAPAGSVSRLFVFSSADAAHSYAKIMDYHDDKYKNVYVCSMQYYENYILPRIRGIESGEDMLKHDFAVLRFSQPDISLYAKLTERSLSYKRIKAEDINYKSLLDLFKEFRKIDRGKLGGENNRVLRWEKGNWRDKESWIEVLKKMFIERTPDAMHLVFVHCPDKSQEEDLKRHFAIIKRKILQKDKDDPESLGLRYHIQNVWFGKVTPQDHQPKDGELKGKLIVNADSPTFLLMMHFQDRPSLAGFEEDNRHSTMREEFFKTLDPRTKMLFEVASTSKDKERESLYEAIEGIISANFKRWDYLNEEMIVEMVQTMDPYDF